MRTREEIEKELESTRKCFTAIRVGGEIMEWEEPNYKPIEKLQTRLLLDIRDLLANPPIEISGEQALDEAWDEARDLLAERLVNKKEVNERLNRFEQ